MYLCVCKQQQKQKTEIKKIDEPLKQGWLQKKGGGKRRANWNKRYFVLCGNRIDYYEDNRLEKLKGTIPIDGHLATFNVIPFSEKKIAFVICLPTRDFVIQAGSDVEMNRCGWCWCWWPAAWRAAAS